MLSVERISPPEGGWAVPVLATGPGDPDGAGLIAAHLARRLEPLFKATYAFRSRGSIYAVGWCPLAVLACVAERVADVLGAGGDIGTGQRVKGKSEVKA